MKYRTSTSVVEPIGSRIDPAVRSRLADRFADWAPTEFEVPRPLVFGRCPACKYRTLIGAWRLPADDQRGQCPRCNAVFGLALIRRVGAA